MTTRRKPSSPLFGWVSAGADLVAEQVEQVTGMVSKQLDATHALFEELQQRGGPVDEQLRQTLSPSSVFTSLQTMVMANPLFSLFAGNKKAATREHQLEVLSAKVDLLVEQVAILAAKKAQQQSAAATAEKAKPATKRATRSKAATTKSTASTATKSTAKSGTGSAKTAEKPTTRKRSSATAKSNTGSGKTSGTTKKAE